ncbi:XrtA/PEP-CTERM system TPR-repeat protein PrsT [Agaribacter flavus]|uniref:XrtA/PEP-CTERM system TPR-repeat protein PrsT n=1 Tax=Agaribacter flavus TaxID=1902781 RepID=A0ABV7FRJ9_9ALTE
MKALFTIFALLFSVNVFSQVSDTYEKALQSYNKNDVESAYIYLKNALQQSPNHLPSKILMGKTLFSKGFARDALIEFEESIAAGADENIVVVDLAKIHLYLGDESAIFNLKDASLNQKNKFELALIKATTAFNTNNDKLAEQFYLDALAINALSPRALQSIAYFYLFTKQSSKAETYIQQLIAINENDQRTLHLQGQLEKSKNNNAEALIYFKKAFDIAPQDPLIQRTLASAYLAVNQLENAKSIVESIIEQTPDDPFALLLYGKLIDSSDTMLDEDVFSQINQKLSLLPDEIKSERAELSFVMALATYMSGNYQQAVTELESYLIKNRKDVNAIGILADAYIKMNQSFKALNLLDKNQSIIKNNLTLNILLCDLYIESPRNFKCELLLDEISKIHKPNNPNIVFARIKALLKRGKNKEALQLFEGLFANQLDPISVYTAIDIYRENDMLNKALDKVNTLIERLPNESQAHIIKAEILIAKTQYQEAITILNNLLAHDSASYSARKNKAIALINTGQYSQAENILSRLIETDNKDASLHTLMGQALLAQDLHERALRALNLSKSLTEDDTYASELLVQVYKRMGEKEKAISELDALLRNRFLFTPYIEEKAKLLIESNDYPKAANELRVLFGLWTKDLNKLLRLAKLQVAANDVNGALKSLSTAEQLAINKAPVLVEMIQVYLLQEDVASAESSLKELQATGIESPVLLLLEGEIAAIEGKIEKAHKAYKAAYSMNNTYVIAAIKLYQLAQKGFKGKEFEAIVSKAIESETTPILISNLLADYYLQQNRIEEALSLYKTLDQESYKNQSIVLNNIATLYLEKLDNIMQAKYYADKALKKAPNSAEIIDTKGWILVKEGRLEEGLTYLRQAYTLLSDDAQIQYHLAYTLHKLSRIDEAKNMILEALNNPNVTLVANKIKELNEDLQAVKGEN